MINPLWLRSFCTLVEVGHFTRTAEQLHMTQSGVSQHIRKLEEQLDVSLLQRDGKSKRFRLTEAGERLHAEAQGIVSALSDLEQRVKDDPAYAGEVRLMSPGSVGLKLYPHLLELQQRHKALVIDYRFADNQQVEASVAASQIDMGYMTRHAQIDNVSCRAVAQESLLLVTPAGLGAPNWDQLIELGFIGHPDGAHHAALLLSANYPEFQNVNQLPQRGFSNQISLILEPVSRGLGFTVLPAYAVEAFTKRDTVTAHRLECPVSETLYLATPMDRLVPNRVKTVIDAAGKLLEALG